MPKCSSVQRLPRKSTKMHLKLAVKRGDASKVQSQVPETMKSGSCTVNNRGCPHALHGCECHLFHWKQNGNETAQIPLLKLSGVLHVAGGGGPVATRECNQYKVSCLEKEVNEFRDWGTTETNER